ncbi:MAG: hypothetical protein KF889_19500 [Alphaproteobacteria bacterium]|nr:hypothetical protein [Alphaproteobacteria bacterium]MCW5744037.1 hypothetical protein [Alphaproteobacteria bacterium]
MRDLAWSAAEKKVARRAYDHALESALAALLAEFKAKAAAVAAPQDMWALEGYLRERRQHIDDLFDYRYSQLILVFARLIREGHLDEARLNGLSEEKREMIRRILAL